MVRRQLLKAIHMEPFDGIVQLLGVVATVVLLVLVVVGTRQYSWYIVFSPLFAANAMSAYFETIVYFRLLFHNQEKEAHKRIIWQAIFLGLLTLFEVLLANHLNGGGTNIGGAIAPVTVLLIAILVRFLAAMIKDPRG